MYFAGSLAYTATAVRALAEAEVGNAWYNIMSLIGVLTYMLGSIAFTSLAVSVHRAQLRVEMRHARDLINALIKTHAVAFELALEHAENEELARELAFTERGTKVPNTGGFLDGTLPSVV